MTKIESLPVIEAEWPSYELQDLEDLKSAPEMYRQAVESIEAEAVEPRSADRLERIAEQVVRTVVYMRPMSQPKRGAAPQTEGLSADDSTSLYLREIGRLPLLDKT